MHTARDLTTESSGLLDTTKEFMAALERTKYELDTDFTEDDIDDNIGDEDFANDFAEQLNDAFTALEKHCVHVIKDCIARKGRLDNALIGWPN